MISLKGEVVLDRYLRKWESNSQLFSSEALTSRGEGDAQWKFTHSKGICNVGLSVGL